MSIVIDEEATWEPTTRLDELPPAIRERVKMIRTTMSDAWLDAVALGVGFYREPIEALASRDPGQAESPRFIEDDSMQGWARGGMIQIPECGDWNR